MKHSIVYKNLWFRWRNIEGKNIYDEETTCLIYASFMIYVSLKLERIKQIWEICQPENKRTKSYTYISVQSIYPFNDWAMTQLEMFI